jgi:thioredoxin-dependent peroxiredoxin
MAEITLKGNPIHTNGELPKVGSQAPDFTLVNSELKNVTLKNFQGKKVLLSIVPSLDTATCATMTRKFNEALKKYPEVVTLVVSADLPFAQSRFCTTEHIEHIIPLSMMRNQEFARDYGILIIDGPLAGICARAIVFLDENHKVTYTQLVKEVSKEPDYPSVLDGLEA